MALDPRAGRHLRDAGYSYPPGCRCVRGTGPMWYRNVGARLLVDLADRVTLTAQLSTVFASRRSPQTTQRSGAGAGGWGGDAGRWWGVHQ
jgi:hypothetical protein